jgi:hypothetical protein
MVLDIVLDIVLDMVFDRGVVFCLGEVVDLGVVVDPGVVVDLGVIDMAPTCYLSRLGSLSPSPHPLIYCEAPHSLHDTVNVQRASSWQERR